MPPALSRHVLMPWQRDVDAAPLLLESMRPALGGATAEVEHAYPATDHVLHECPVEEHVGGKTAGLVERPRPRHLELVAPHKPAAAGHWLVPMVDHAEHDQLRERCCDALEERARHHRRT